MVRPALVLKLRLHCNNCKEFTQSGEPIIIKKGKRQQIFHNSSMYYL